MREVHAVLQCAAAAAGGGGIHHPQRGSLLVLRGETRHRVRRNSDAFIAFKPSPPPSLCLSLPEVSLPSVRPSVCPSGRPSFPPPLPPSLLPSSPPSLPPFLCCRLALLLAWNLITACRPTITTSTLDPTTPCTSRPVTWKIRTQLLTLSL